MSAGAPWSVKGIDPKAREIAKDLARRSGMTLGEWLNQMIIEGDADSDPVVTPLGRRTPPWSGLDRRGRLRRLDDAYDDEAPASRSPRGDEDLERVARALDDLTHRLEAAENRSTLAIGGVDQAVAGLLARLEGTERDHSATSARLEHVAEDLRDEQGRVIDRIRQIEREGANPRHTEALRALETALGKIANQIYEGDARTRATLSETGDQMAAVARRVERLEAEDNRPDTALLVDGVVARITERLEQAEARTAGAIRALESSFTHLDDRLRNAESHIDPDREGRFERLAEDLASRVEESRSELISRFEAMGDVRFDQVERALSDLSDHIGAAEQRSAKAIESMGHEVLRIAHNINGRMTGVETSSAQAVERAQGEMSRMAHAVEARLRKADDGHAQALEKLGAEISRISERLSERISHAERRSTLASDDMGERIGRLADKLENRAEKSSSELAERIRQSEERTAKLLEEARSTLDRTLNRAEHRAATLAAVAEPAPSISQPTAYAADPWAEPEPATPRLDPAALFDEPAPAFPAFPSVEPQAAASTPEAVPTFDDYFTPEPFGTAETAPVHAELPPAAAAEDEFSADTEFLTPEELRARARPPVSTKEAIDAARAAARLGVRNSAPEDRGGLFGLKGGGAAGKTRLQERIDREAKRDGSTVKKALLATGVATILVVTVVGGYTMLPEDQKGSGKPLSIIPRDFLKTPADGGAAPLAAVALGQTQALSGADKAKAEALYQEAVEKVPNKKAGGLDALTKSANLGYGPAQYFLASLYAAGDSGVTKDPVEARVWFERAAQGGDRKAMFNMGMFYFEGTGGPKDEAAAAKWFRKAADLGLIDGQYNLARLYEQGSGVARDPAEAYKWYLIAARSGDEEARAAAEALSPLLAPDQRDSATLAARAFRPAEGDPAAAAGR